MPNFAIPKTLRLCATGLLLALVPMHATAQATTQLYTWKDADGQVTIMNTPPPWYKEAERTRGPRVQVLRNGKVIDDTAWPLARRQEGRSQAAKAEAAAAAKKADDD